MIRVGIVAPAGPVPPLALKSGLKRLEQGGMEVFVHPQVKLKKTFFAGEDRERAEAFFTAAWSPDFDIVWSARGGYGSARILPDLLEFEKRYGRPPRKTLIGSSDITALFGFVSERWGWRVLHGPMPGVDRFEKLSAREWSSLQKSIVENWETHPLVKRKVKWIGTPPDRAIRGRFVGGNLTVWVSQIGTAFEQSSKRRVLFLEDVGEYAFRLDRLVHQLEASGGLKGVQAILLGNFKDCRDAAPLIPGKKTLRPVMAQPKFLREIFESLGERLSVPVGVGLPVGHGPDQWTIPLGGERVEIRPDGGIRFGP